MSVDKPPELGIGVVYSRRLADALDLEQVDVVEVEPQTLWYRTGAPQDAIRDDLEVFSRVRSGSRHCLVHSVGLPIGNSRPHDSAALRQLRQCIVALDAPYASEHLSFDRFEEHHGLQWSGFLLPPKQDRHAVGIAATRIDEMRSAVGVPVAFENGVNYLRPIANELADGEFLRRVAEAADCGILLDLHNLLTNERNGRDTVAHVLEEIPLDRVWEIHLAGGMEYRGYWLDSHTDHIEDRLFNLARAVVDECPNLSAIVFEIMGASIGQHSGAALQEDLRRLRALWQERRRPTIVTKPRSSAIPLSISSYDPTTVRLREQTLGAAAVGRVQHDDEPGIVEDPGAALYADLVASMREGVLHDTLPFLMRLLFVTLGRESLMALIGEFRADVLPQAYGSDEAKRFIAYVRARELAAPYIAEILNLEEAVIAVAGAPGEVSVDFNCDPELLLGTLLTRASPADLPLKQFRVIVRCRETNEVSLSLLDRPTLAA